MDTKPGPLEQPPLDENQEKTEELFFCVFFKGLSHDKVDEGQQFLDDKLQGAQNLAGGLTDKAQNLTGDLADKASGLTDMATDFAEAQKEKAKEEAAKHLSKLETGDENSPLSVGGFSDSAKDLIDFGADQAFGENSALGGAAKDADKTLTDETAKINDEVEDKSKTIDETIGEYSYDLRIFQNCQSENIDHNNPLGSAGTLAGQMMAKDEDEQMLIDWQVYEVVNQINRFLAGKANSKLSLHFDIFGFQFGVKAAEKLISDFNELFSNKNYPNVNNAEIRRQQLIDAGASAMKSVF